MRAVIFDLDGTLINSRIDFKKMKRNVIVYLQSEGVEPGLLNDDMLNHEITSTATENLQQKGRSKDQIESVLSKVSEIMNDVELESLDNATLVEDVLETLKALKAEGSKLGIMTRSCRRYAEYILVKFQLNKYFDAVVARDDVEKSKPNPEHAFHVLRLLGVSAEKAIFIGDHWSDAECARRAGIRFVLFKRQAQSTQPLKGFEFQTIDSIRDIVELARTTG